MAGIMDKIKGLFGGKSKTAGGAEPTSVDALKDQAGDVKDTVDDLVDQHGDKIPDSVEGAYDSVSDKVEDVIPGGDSPDAPVPGA